MSRFSPKIRSMKIQNLTIKELTEAVGGGITPRMVRHYHTVGLLPQPSRSASNYRLYNQRDVQQLKQIVALKQQGFQLAHIQQLIQNESAIEAEPTLILQLQQQYQTIVQQLARLRQTAAALEGVLGRDQDCQMIQAEALAQLRRLEAEGGFGELEKLWHHLDVETTSHPEAFQESLQRLLPDLSDRSEIEVDLLSKLVLACGDVSLIQFVRRSRDAIAAARDALKANCTIVGDILPVVSALDQTRLAHLDCPVETLIADLHINRPFQKFTSDTVPGFEGNLTRIVAGRNHAGLQQFLSAMNHQDRGLTSPSPPVFSTS